MTDNEKWNKICEIFNKNITSPEDAIQKKWEKIFAELFGYSSLDNEIDIHRKMKLGSTERLIPDIIIKNQQNDLFIVELKQETLPVTSNLEQLFSYLKQLKCDLGILICNKICLIDYDYNISDGEQIKFEIEFIKDNFDGIKFVEFFGKENFDKDKIKEFIRKRSMTMKNIESIKCDLENSKELIMNLLKEHFLKNYSTEEFEEAIKGFEICVNKKGAVHSTVLSSRVSKKVSKINSKNSIGNISKSDAIDLCLDNGIYVSGNITFSSTNKANGKFWANPDISFLNDDWWLLLNDKEKGELHVLFVPSGSIDENEIVVRTDKPYKIDLQINNDDSFQDSRSKIMFGGFLIETLVYEGVKFSV